MINLIKLSQVTEEKKKNALYFAYEINDDDYTIFGKLTGAHVVIKQKKWDEGGDGGVV